jgi:Glycosyl transferase 4-like domain
MRRVLIVCPRFPPKNAPDMHRVRTSLPYYRKFGWDPTVLCLTPDSSDGVDDIMLGESLPPNVDIVRAPAWDEAACRRFGFGHLDYRCILPIYRAGNAILSQKTYDVIFFSSTVFLTFLLGPIWKRRFGCKIVYDFQDPWYQEKSLYTKRKVPGVWWKYRLGRLLSRYFESYAVRRADHIISVSDGYVKDLSARYTWLRADQSTIIPFGAAELDFDFVKARGIKSPVICDGSRFTRWVYAGRGGPDMDPILAVLFTQLALLKRNEPTFYKQLRVQFVGTNYSPRHRTYKVIEPLAIRYGVADIVDEHCNRIPYHETLALYNESDAVLLIGSMLSEYTPSKLFNCILSKKPVLALLHASSLGCAIAQQFHNVRLAKFLKEPTEPGFANSVGEGLQWLRGHELDVVCDSYALNGWTAENLTSTQCSVFASVCDR